MKTTSKLFVLMAALVSVMAADIQSQTTNPPYLSQFPSPERIKADVRGVDAMETAAKQAGIFWQLQQLISLLAWSQKRTDRQFTADEQRLEPLYRNAYYYAMEPFEGKVTGPDRLRWFELHTKYEIDSWLRDEVFKKYFTPELRSAVYVALKWRAPTKNAPDGSLLAPTAAEIAAHKAKSAASPPQPTAQTRVLGGGSGADYLSQGNKYDDAKDYINAIAAYKKAIALKPETIVIEASYSRMGMTHIKLEQYEEAISALREALRLSANNHFANNQLGLAYHGLGQYSEAVEAFQQAIRQQAATLEPLDSTYRQNLGVTYVEMGRKEEALQVYNALLTLDKKKAQELHAKINKGPTSQPAAKSGKTGSQPAGTKTAPASAQVPLTGPDPSLVTRAEQGSTIAQKQLGDYYFNRKKDPENGLKWLKKSAEAGYADAQNSLGYRYENGKGLPENKTEARKWYRLAAEQGNASGKANLCKYYASELKIFDDSDDDPKAPIRALNGSKTDVEEAIKWCAASAILTPLSHYKLALLYAKGGADVKPNYEEAYFWLSMSGGEDVFRDKVGKKLTPEKRAEIAQRAKEWTLGTKP